MRFDVRAGRPGGGMYFGAGGRAMSKKSALALSAPCRPNAAC